MMCRRLILSLVCLSCVATFLTRATSARLTVSVNEAETRFFFKQLAPEVSLAVANGERDTADVAIALELIDPDNTVLGKTERRALLKPGSQKVLFALPLKAKDLSPDEDNTAL